MSRIRKTPRGLYASRWEDVGDVLFRRFELGAWEEKILKLGSKWTFRAVRGGVVNWWESTGKIGFQGPPEERERLEELLARAPVGTPEIEIGFCFPVAGIGGRERCVSV